MTGLEPHPVFKLPTPDQVRALERAMGREVAAQRLDQLRQERQRLMELERADPFNYGYEPPIWGLIDDLLVEGAQVELVGRPYLEIPDDILKTKSPSLIITGQRELLISGANGASKTEYAAKKVMKILRGAADRKAWCFHETERESIDRQQPLFMKFMEPRLRQIVLNTGRFKQGAITNISWTQKNGFTESSFVLPNGSSNLFKNYKQEEQTVEGGQIDIGWGDELIPVALARTLRFRLMGRKGILLLTFTPIKGWTAAVQEFRQGERVLVKATAPRVPLKDEHGKLTGKFKKVPRISVAGPGTQGTLKANVIYLHSADNPFLDEKELDRILEGGTEQTILERGYGVATKAYANQCPKFSDDVHVVGPDKIPRMGTNYHIVDPCPGRNWYMLWVRIAPNPIRRPDGSLAYKRFVYREWPSTGHGGPSAYIPGMQDPGAWAVPGNDADGDRGPAQDPFGWGLDRYKTEILRVEGKRGQSGSQVVDSPGRESRNGAADGEDIMERLMDSRAGATPTQTNARITTLLEQMGEIGMYFVPASGKDIGEGVGMINDGLDFDDQVPIGQYSPSLARVNEPLLYISSECPNLIYSLREWTGKDGLKGACKDPIDTLRYALEADVQFVGADAFRWQGGGSY